jgi:hypothetical protein
MPTRPAQQQDAGDQDKPDTSMKLHVYPRLLSAEWADVSNQDMIEIKISKLSEKSSCCLMPQQRAQIMFGRDRPRLVCDPSGRFRPQLVVDRHASLGLSALNAC